MLIHDYGDLIDRPTDTPPATPLAHRRHRREVTWSCPVLFNETRARNYMERYDLDALIATSPANIRYLTGYVCCFDPVMKEYMLNPGAGSQLMQSYALYPRDGKVALVVNPFFAVNASALWVEDLYLFGQTAVDLSHSGESGSQSLQSVRHLLEEAGDCVTASAALLKAITDRGLSNGRIGIELEPLPGDCERAISNGLPQANIRDATNLLRLVRMVKSPEELARMARAAAISEDLALPILSEAATGVTMRELSQRYRAGVAAAGADFEHFVYSIRGLGLAQAETDHVITEDDSMQCDFGCIYEGYYSDTGVTLAMKRAPEAHMAKYQHLRAAVNAAFDTMAPGVRASAVHGALHSTLGERGVAATDGSGHGLGIEIRDYPIIVADNGRRIVDDCVDEPSDLPLEEGMVLNVEAGCYVADVGVVFIEQTSVVTADGSRPLVNQDRSSPLVPLRS